MTINHTDNVVINDTADEVQLVVKGAATQTVALQQWQDSAAAVLSEVDEDGHLLVGDQDGTIDALIESHNIEDSAKPSRGLHAKGILTGTLSGLVSWVVNELGLKGTGGISALHRALRVQATNENTGAMAAGADVRAGDFEAINTGGNVTTNNLEMSALVAKVDNQSGATLDKAYGLKVELTDAGTSNETYAIYTDNGIVHLGDLLELVAGVVLEDSASDGVLGITPRSVAPTSPTSGMMYLDDGTNRADGLAGFRRWNGSSWDDIVDTSAIGDGNVSGPGSSTDNALSRFDSTTGKLLQNSGALLDDSNNLSVNSILPTVDVTVANGGTGASDAGTARTNLGLAIGSDVQAWDAHLDDLAGIIPAKGDIFYFDGTNWVKLAIGTDNHVLKVNVDVPNWEAESGGGAVNIGISSFTTETWSTNSGSFVVADATYLSHTLTTGAGYLVVQLAGMIWDAGTGSRHLVTGFRLNSGNTVAMQVNDSNRDDSPVGWTGIIPVSAGSNTIDLMFRSLTSTTRMEARDPSYFAVWELL